MNIKMYYPRLDFLEIQWIEFNIEIIWNQKKKILSCFDDKIYIQDNRYDGLALDYWRLL